MALTLDQDFVTHVFHELSKLQMIPLLATSLKSDDHELVSWAIFFLHEFAHRDVLRDEIRKIRHLMKVFNPILGQTQNVISRIVLRILKCLCKNNSNLISY